MMKIVLAIDGSDFSKEAVNELVKMPLPDDSEISIINVYEHPAMSTPELMTMGGSLNNYFEEFISGAQKIGNKIVSEASGLPKSAILEKAESFDADLIVVGSQGQGAFSRFLLGSVSQYLAAHAKCSVMIVKDKGVK
jgi:nucleotide-binding universal stress UspA family protein